MMRFSVSTWNVLKLKMPGMWEGTTHNFMFMGVTSEKLSFDFDSDNKPDKKPMAIAPFSSKQSEGGNLEGFDIHNETPNGRFRRYRNMSDTPRPRVSVQTEILAQQKLTDCSSERTSLPGNSLHR